MFSKSNCFYCPGRSKTALSLISKDNKRSAKEADCAGSDALVTCIKVEIHPSAAPISKPKRTCKVKRLKMFHSSSKLLVVLKC